MKNNTKITTTKENKNPQENPSSFKKILAWALAALTIVTTWCDSRPSSIKNEISYVENNDQEKLINNFLKEFKTDYPQAFSSEKLNTLEKEVLKKQELVNDIIWLLLVNYPNIYNKLIIADLPADIDLLLNESLKKSQIRFNTSLNISPNWPSNKQQIPTVDYTNFFQTYEIMKSEKIGKYPLKPDKYTYQLEKHSDYKEYKLNPLVVMYDYNRFWTNLKIPKDKLFINSYYLVEEDFPSIDDFYGEPSRDKAIIITTNPINEDLNKYITKLKKSNIPVDIYFINLDTLSIENWEKLTEIKKFIQSKVENQVHNNHWGSAFPWFWYYYLLTNSNSKTHPISTSSYVVRPSQQKTTPQIRNFPATFKNVSISWRAIRWAGAGKWFSAKWWLW